MRKIEGGFHDMNDPELLTLKADLWLEMRKAFEKHNIRPFAGGLHFYTSHLQKLVMGISVIFLTKEEYTIHEDYDLPATWLDMFKEKYFPKWLKKRFPVKYRKLEHYKRYFKVCPHHDVQFQGSSDTVHLPWLVMGLDGDIKPESNDLNSGD